MMIRNSREKAPQATQEGGLDGAKASAAAASSRPWTGLRDPRVVRVARSLGGKDRHSKVSTIRGLRDRRVRLSLPTAIQLYDLQDWLGVNQPSKVVDWLLDAARHEIDKLPPLLFPPGSFFQYPPAMAAPNGVPPPEEVPPSGPSMVANMECREGAKRRSSIRRAMEEKDGLFVRIEQEQRAAEAYSTSIPVPGDLYGQSHASMPSMLGSSSEHSSCYHMEAPNQLCVPHLGCYPISQVEELHGNRPAMPPLPMHSTYAAASAGYDHKHTDSLQMGSSASMGFMLSYAPSSPHTSSANMDMGPFQLSISSRRHHSQHNHESNGTEQLL